MASRSKKIEIFEREYFYADFPKLNKKNHAVTSSPTPTVRFPKKPYHVYNCLGMAVGDETRVWWPGGHGYWPRQPSQDTVEELMFILETQFGYKECKDGRLEENVRKIAIFVDNKNIPQHVSFQPKFTGSTGRRLKSKMGFNVNIEHELLAVVSKLYGSPTKFMAKNL